MKFVVVVGLLSVALSSCGKKDDNDSDTAVKCSGPSVGTWKGDGNPDILVLGDDEVFSYTGDDKCKTAGTYACPGNIESGTLKVTIKTAEASEYCLPAGEYTCPFSLKSSALTFYCTGDNGKGAARNYKK